MAQASLKEFVGPLLAVLLLVTCASPATAQISIPMPGSGDGKIGLEESTETRSISRLEKSLSLSLRERDT